MPGWAKTFRAKVAKPRDLMARGWLRASELHPGRCQGPPGGLRRGPDPRLYRALVVRAKFAYNLLPPYPGECGIKKEQSKRARTNDEITATPVRLIAEDGEQKGILPLQQAMSAARDAGLDLVEIAPDAQPVVCKLMDYGKHIFEAKKDKAASKKKQRRMHVKEMKTLSTKNLF